VVGRPVSVSSKSPKPKVIKTRSTETPKVEEKKQHLILHQSSSVSQIRQKKKQSCACVCIWCCSLEKTQKSILSAKRWLHEKLRTPRWGVIAMVSIYAIIRLRGRESSRFIGRKSWRAVLGCRRREGASCPGCACSWKGGYVDGKSRSVGNPCVAC
jgi:hypothetical protein